jgi:hypothetical protein
MFRTAHRSKHVEPSINFGIINYILKLHLVGNFTETFLKIYLQGCCRSQCKAWQRKYRCSFCRMSEIAAAVKTHGVIFCVMALCSLVSVYPQYFLFIHLSSLGYSAASLRWSTRCKIMPCSFCLCAPGVKYRLDHIPVFQGLSLLCWYRFIS